MGLYGMPHPFHHNWTKPSWKMLAIHDNIHDIMTTMPALLTSVLGLPLLAVSPLSVCHSLVYLIFNVEYIVCVCI